MPWTVDKDTDKCPASKPWAVTNKDTGELVPNGCHDTKQKAIDQIGALESQDVASRVWSRHVAAATVEPSPEIELITIPDVELCEVGENWRLSTGLTTFTMDDFAAAVAAQDDPFIRTPKIKIGHSDPRFDGEPCFGKIENLRTTNGGATLVGDLVGVPKWFAEIMPSAYPQRSIEASWNVKTAQGKEHAFVITALALLGETDPGVETLADLQTLWENGPQIAELQPVEASQTATIEGGDVDVGKIRRAIHAAAAKVKASVEVEDVRRGYYESLDSSQMWWWIRAIQIDPPQLIVDDDEGNLYRVPYTVNGDDVEFGEAVKVTIQYQDAAASNKHPQFGGVWASKEESRAGVGPDTEEAGMDPKLRAALIKAHGLAEDATDEQITAAVEQAAEANPPAEGDTTPQAPGDEGGTGAEQPGSAPETATPATPAPGAEGQPPVKVPDGMALVDAETVEQLKTAAGQGKTAYDTMKKQERDKLLNDAVKAGKFAPSRREHFENLLKADEEGTKQLIESMAAGVVPVEMRGHGEDVDASGQQGDAYPDHWLPEVKARREREQGRV